MNAQIVLSSILLLAAVGCAQQSTSRRFAVSFDDADERLRQLYPSGRGFLATRSADTQPAGERRLVLRTVRTPHLTGPQVAIQRNEMTTGRTLILITEGDKLVTRRTEIVLKALEPDQTQVSVQTSKSGKAVLLPPRDQAYEQKQMETIAKALKN